jgi:hypothetical protein
MRAIAILISTTALSLGSSTAAPPLGPSVPVLEATLLNEATGIHPEALHAALSSWSALNARGDVHSPLLCVIDYGLPSTQKRMWVFDLSTERLLFNELVAHGRNSGEDLAESFSNDDGSYMSSLGAFVTGSTYDGHNGYSLRLRGTEPSVNDRAEARAIVMHGAWYVDEELAQKQGRLGRSLGCPAVRPEIAHALIDEIKDGSVLYAWHPSIAPAPITQLTAR